MIKKSSKGIMTAVISAAVLLSGCGDAQVKGEENADVSVSDSSAYVLPDLSQAKNITAADNTSHKIVSAGIYVLSGSAENFTLTVEANEKAKVQIVLDGADIVNNGKPVILVNNAGECVVMTDDGKSSLSVDGVSDTDTDAVIYSECDLTVGGKGELVIVSSDGNGITCKDTFKADGGKFTVDSALDAIEAKNAAHFSAGEFNITAGKDAVHCEDKDDLSDGSIMIGGGVFNINAADDGIQAVASLTIDGGTFNISSAEGMEAAVIQINGGDISIEASDDGINASSDDPTVEMSVEINGGHLRITMGAGDTDGIDSNGSVIVNGGTVEINAQMSAFDYESPAQFNGGKIIINGEEVNEISNQMMGPGGRNGFGGPEGRGERSERPQDGMPDGMPEFDPNFKPEFDPNFKPEFGEKPPMESGMTEQQTESAAEDTI